MFGLSWPGMWTCQVCCQESRRMFKLVKRDQVVLCNLLQKSKLYYVLEVFTDSMDLRLSLMFGLYNIYCCRCVTGNLAEFVLSPVFSNRGTVFGCHIETKSTYKIYDIDYTVLYNGKPINNKVLKAQKIFRGVHPEKAIDEYVNFLFAGSLESANWSILAARNLCKDFGGEKNQDFMIMRCPITWLFISDVILQCHNFTGQHVRQRHDVIFVYFLPKIPKHLPWGFKKFFKCSPIFWCDVICHILKVMSLCVTFRHNFLKVYYGSEVNAKPDFIEGDSAMKTFSAGSYMDAGLNVEDMDVTTRTLSVRPRKPFSVSSQMWSKLSSEI